MCPCGDPWAMHVCGHKQMAIAQITRQLFSTWVTEVTDSFWELLNGAMLGKMDLARFSKIVHFQNCRGMACTCENT